MELGLTNPGAVVMCDVYLASAAYDSTAIGIKGAPQPKLLYGDRRNLELFPDRDAVDRSRHSKLVRTTCYRGEIHSPLLHK